MASWGRNIVLGTVIALAGSGATRAAETLPPATDEAYQTAHQQALDAFLATTDREERMSIPMRDGTQLAATIFFPKGVVRKAMPTILFFSPYKADDLTSEFAFYLQSLAAHGYVAAFVPERGHYGSQGIFTYMGRVGEDSYDTIDWLSKQPWSSGKIGALGTSGSGEEQMRMNMMHHPALAAVVPIAAGAGIGRIGPYAEWGNFYRGGVINNLWFSWSPTGGYKYSPQFPAWLPRDQAIRAAKYWAVDPVVPDWDDKVKAALKTLPEDKILEKLDAPPSDLDEDIRRQPNDPIWKELGYGNEGGQWGAPTLMFNSWYDIAIGPNLAMYDYQVKNAATPLARDNTFVVVSPTDHATPGYRDRAHTIIGERDFGDIRYDSVGLVQAWFDHWLKGIDNGVTARPKARIFTMGINKWQDFPSWPLPNTKPLTLFLDSGGSANGLAGNGRLVEAAPTTGSDRFTYDPLNPAPSVGGQTFPFGDVKPGPFDQRKLEQRADVLNFSTEPFKAPLQVTGPIKVSLFLSSDAKDTDLMVTMVDVAPDGTAYNLDMGIMRARWRNGFDGPPAFMEKGGVYAIDLPPLVTSNVFLPGHRLRVSITSSAFPAFERNLNTGGNNYAETEPRVAHNVIWHGAGRLSKIVLPVVE